MKKHINVNVLELTSKHQFIPAQGFDKKIELFKIKKNPGFVYTSALESNLKHERPEQLSPNKDILAHNPAFPELHFFLALHKGQITGSFDLIILPDNEIEIRNFGLHPGCDDFVLRAMILSKAVDYCFRFDPKRIFHQTSEFDKMSSIANYLSQGFAISTQNENIEESSKVEKKHDLISDFLINLN